MNDLSCFYKSGYLSKAVEKARKGEGPTLFECKTYRHKGHSRIDPAKYRPNEEVEKWLRKDPVKRFKKQLLQTNVLSETEIQRLENEVLAEIEEAANFAMESPHPAQKEALEDVYT